MNHTDSIGPSGDNTQQPKDVGRLTAGKIARIVGWVIAGLAMACLFALIFGLLVKWLWGMTLTPLFNLAQPTYWQAVGLIVLARLLFGGFGHHKQGNHSTQHTKWHDRFCGHADKSRWHSEVKPVVAGRETL
jgi:hypothetical protein